MKTLKEIIELGNNKILNGDSNNYYAAIYMAYHAGISKGREIIEGQWRDLDYINRKEALKERYINIATKYIPTAPPKPAIPEYKEILNFDYNF